MNETQTVYVGFHEQHDAGAYKNSKKCEFDVEVLWNPNYRDFRNDVADEINSDVEFKQFGNTLQANRVTLYKCTTDGSRGERLVSRNFQEDGTNEIFALIAQPVQKQDTKQGGGNTVGKLVCVVVCLVVLSTIMYVLCRLHCFFSRSVYVRKRSS
jgi:hypothetical protein